ncbi:GTPase-associated protein 1-related protein [Streptomyces flavofungini]|uniref:Uncharacterized protein n=1 Tax=Streptomyces flavofungini TaxID=68200 RepID=A0ABS0X8M8_9ACTN|nr:GTPase-associated protein 1-related protein [Streptomyces flavofungini]MBJ3809555.1 hypothetical protein [Streptomyces flavofungini]GHC55501.1 hypothetical protein GCM10010349_22220 [Streptomyces flavofungini]
MAIRHLNYRLDEEPVTGAVRLVPVPVPPASPVPSDPPDPVGAPVSVPAQASAPAAEGAAGPGFPSTSTSASTSASTAASTAASAAVSAADAEVAEWVVLAIGAGCGPDAGASGRAAPFSFSRLPDGASLLCRTAAAGRGVRAIHLTGADAARFAEEWPVTLLAAGAALEADAGVGGAELPGADGPFSRARLTAFARAHEPRVAPFLADVRRLFDDPAGRQLVVAEESPDTVARWIALACASLPPAYVPSLTFTTRAADPARAPQHIIGIGPDADFDRFDVTTLDHLYRVHDGIDGPGSPAATDLWATWTARLWVAGVPLPRAAGDAGGVVAARDGVDGAADPMAASGIDPTAESAAARMVKSGAVHTSESGGHPTADSDPIADPDADHFSPTRLVPALLGGGLLSGRDVAALTGDALRDAVAALVAAVGVSGGGPSAGVGGPSPGGVGLSAGGGDPSAAGDGGSGGDAGASEAGASEASAPEEGASEAAAPEAPADIPPPPHTDVPPPADLTRLTTLCQELHTHAPAAAAPLALALARRRLGAARPGELPGELGAVCAELPLGRDNERALRAAYGGDADEALWRALRKPPAAWVEPLRLALAVRADGGRGIESAMNRLARALRATDGADREQAVHVLDAVDYAPLTRRVLKLLGADGGTGRLDLLRELAASPQGDWLRRNLDENSPLSLRLAEAAARWSGPGNGLRGIDLFGKLTEILPGRRVSDPATLRQVWRLVWRTGGPAPDELPWVARTCTVPLLVQARLGTHITGVVTAPDRIDQETVAFARDLLHDRDLRRHQRATAQLLVLAQDLADQRLSLPQSVHRLQALQDDAAPLDVAVRRGVGALVALALVRADAHQLARSPVFEYLISEGPEVLHPYRQLMLDERRRDELERNLPPQPEEIGAYYYLWRPQRRPGVSHDWRQVAQELLHEILAPVVARLDERRLGDVATAIVHRQGEARLQEWNAWRHGFRDG